MSNTSILSVIQYYQRSIEKYQTDEARLLHCVSKLYKLPVKVEHLQETGIGKTVNALRKYEGEIGSAAKALVTKWKAMVAAEEEPMETDCNEHETNNSNGNEDETDDENNHDHNGNSNKIEHNERSPQTTKEPERSDGHNKNKEKGHHKHSSSSSHHKSSSSSSNAHESLSSSKHKSKSNQSSSLSSSAEKKKSNSESHHKSRGRDEDKRETKIEKIKEKEVVERGKEDKYKSSASSSSSSRNKDKDGSISNKKEHANASDESHSKKTKSSSSSHKESSHRHSSKEHKDREKSSALKEKEQKIQKDVESSKEKHKSTSKEREHNHEKNKHKSSSKPTSTSSSSSVHKTKDSTSTSTDHVVHTTSSQATTERKRHRHNSEQDSSSESVPQKPKLAKQNKSIASAEENDNDEADFIDSSMGANFADVLGMLNMPTKKSKKLSSSLKSPSASVKASPSTNSKSASSSSKDNQHKSNSGDSSSSKLNGIKSSSSAVASTSKKPDLTKPDLLSSSAKLEPLDPSIALELPTISNNYKPMPLNQTVMDCVFASSSSSSYSSAPKAPVRTLTDAEALKHGISSKTMRTKIYSGVRTGQLMQVPTLFDLCIRVLQKNIDALEYTGGVPFEVLRPVLDRATPQQLLIFEEYNPYLMEDSDVLWQQHVQRHYRAQKRKEMESWREMFLRCQEDQERKLNILAESIKQSQKIIAAPVRKTQLAFVDSMVKPPRNVLRKQEQYGTKSKLVATPAARVASLSNATPNAAKTGDTRLRVAASVRDHAQVSSAVRPKKAPLMAKTLQFIRGRQKR